MAEPVAPNEPRLLPLGRPRQVPVIHAYSDFIPHIITPQSITLFSGASGVGKTTLLTSWIARFMRGQKICGKPTNCPQHKIGVVATDRGGESYRILFRKLGIPDTPFYSLRDDTLFKGTWWLKPELLIRLLRESIEQLALGPQSLVLIDTFAPFIAGNLKDYKTPMAYLHMISSEICRGMDVTIIGVNHTAKQSTDKKYTRNQDRIYGSTAFLGYTDTQMYLVDDDDTGMKGVYEFGWIPHCAPAEKFFFTRNDQGLFIPYTPQEDTMEQAKQSEEQSHLEFIRSIISPDVLGTKVGVIIDACEQRGISSRETVNKYLKSLEELGKIEKAGHGHWRRTAVN